MSNESSTSAAWRIVDLFAGAGGLSHGFLTASDRFEHIQGVELDSAAAETYKANIGTVFSGSIEDWLTGEVPQADIVLGGPPCQGFSLLGKRDADDPRNHLWSNYLEAIARIRPKIFVMENVAAFANTDAFQAMSRDLEESLRFRRGDYTVSHKILNGADHGVAQNRKRVFIVGRLAGVGGFEFPAPQEKVKTVRDMIGGIPQPTTANWPEKTSNGIARGPYLTSELHIDRNYIELSRNRFKAIPPGGNRFDLPEELLAPCWKTHRSGSGDVMGRLRWDEPSVTIRTEFFKPEKGRYLHPTQHRAITHREAALLQGFPDDYRWYGTRVEIARQIGNAVPPPLARALAQSVLDAIEGDPRVSSAKDNEARLDRIA